MLRRILRLTLALSLAAGAVGASADARGFARPPGAGADQSEVMIDPSDIRVQDPVISDAMRAKLRKILAKRRAQNVAAFRVYAVRGVYPHNYQRPGALNVWTDRDGHLCAAATMIFKSGAKTLVRKTAKSNNYIRLIDVTEGPLMDWMLTSGLTQAEIGDIQAPMVMPTPPRELEPQTPTDWRVAEDARLREHYDQVLVSLAENTDFSLDAAINVLAARPDLIAKLIA